MKKLIFILTILVMLIFSTSIAISSATKGKNTMATQLSEKKILIAYYSNSGNTKSVAEKIKMQTNADMFEIIPLKPYPKSYSELTEYAQNEKANKQLPELKNVIDISSYDVIFIGTPIWWGTIANPVGTFIVRNDFKGKTIAPFVTHGGGGGYNVAQDIKNLVPSTQVTTQLTIAGRGGNNTNKEIREWLSKIDLNN